MKPRILDDQLLRRLAAEHGTPLYVLDHDRVWTRLAELTDFDRVRYAQKAHSSLALLCAMRARGVHVDAVSAGEILRARRAGFTADEIVFTADLFDRAALELVVRDGLHVNCGSADMLEALARVRPGTNVTLRVNPGFGSGHHTKVSTGGAGSKHGIWHAEFASAVVRAKRLGLCVSGVHVHIGSGAEPALLERATHAVELAAAAVGASLATLSAGGGLPIPYQDGEPRVDLAHYTAAWMELRERLSVRASRALELEVEPGRYLVAEAGLLLCEVRGKKRSGSNEFVLVDAGFHTLLRPAMYGAYHQISVVGKDHLARHPTLVAGPLCESADVLTQTRDGRLAPQELPRVEVGDLICVHDAGAYGLSMASNYNSQPLPAEVHLRAGRAQLARRRQSFDELFASELELSD